MKRKELLNLLKNIECIRHKGKVVLSKEEIIKIKEKDK